MNISVAMVIRVAMSSGSAAIRVTSEEPWENRQEVLFQALEKLPVALTFIDRDARYRFANQRYLSWSGRTREQLLGRKAEEVWGREAIAYIWPHFQRALKGEFISTIYDLHLTELGPTQIRLTMAPLYGEQHKILGVVSVSEDLTRVISSFAVQSKDYQQALISVVPDPLFVKDVGSRVLLVNPAAETLFGMQAPEIQGKSAPGYIKDPEAANLILKTDRQVVATGKTLRLEEKVDVPAAGIRYLDVIKAPIFNPSGEVVAIAGVARDITAAKEAKRELERNLWHFEGLDRISGIIAQTLNLEEVINRALEVVLEIFGADRAWLIYPCDAKATTWSIPFEVTVPEFPGGKALGGDFKVEPPLADSFNEALRLSSPLVIGPERNQGFSWGESFSIMSQMCMALRPRVGKPWLLGIHQCSGPRDWSHEEIRLFDAIGHRLNDTLTNLLLHRDLERSSEALRESNENFRAIAERAGIGMLVAVDQGRISFVNAQLAELLGYTTEELSMRNIGDLVEVAQRPHSVECFQGVLEGKPVPLAYETLLVRKDGSLTPVEINNVATTWKGQPADLILIRDIREKKRQEQERLALFESERFARREAERASRAKDIFLATLSHELKTPLTSILSWTQLLKLGTLPPEKARRGLDALEKAAITQARLINDLLDLSRVISGKLSIEPRAVDPQPVIQGVVESLLPQAEERGLVIESSFDRSGKLEVFADPVRLQQIVWNLLTNALKFTPRGGKVWVSCRVVDGLFSVEVRDTGKGIAPEFLPRLFDAFAQEDNSARAQGGLGLGLAIVHRLLQLQGGRIEVESPGQGKGATFRFYLRVNSLKPKV